MAESVSEEVNQDGGSIPPSAALVLERFRPYINQNGMIPYPQTVSQNDTVFTAYAIMAIIDELGHLPFLWKKNLSEAYAKHLRADGATLRTPTSTELDSNDNLTGWAIASFYLDKPEFAQKILAYARANGWVWPGEEPMLKRYLGRHRAVEAHLMLAAGEKPDFIVQFFWGIAVVLSMFSKTEDADAYSLSYCLVRLVHDKPEAPVPMVILGWVWKAVMAVRHRSMSENLGRFYGWGGSPHAEFIKG